VDNGRVIVPNGTSSSGKATLALALQERLDEPYMHVSLDVDACVDTIVEALLREDAPRPLARLRSGDWDADAGGPGGTRSVAR
jgi:chloramphenicol 3-O phosphotransferase